MDDIKRDYQNLVLSNYSVVDEINWCIKKKFYQQALTLIESRISNLLFNEWKLLKLNTNPWTGNENSRFSKATVYYEIKYDNERYSKYIINYTTKASDPDKPISSVNADINDFFNGFVYNFQSPKHDKNGEIIQKDGKDTFKPFLENNDFNSMNNEKYEHFIEHLSQINYYSVNTQIDTRIRIARMRLQIPSSPRINLPYCVTVSDKTNKRLLFQLLVLHKTLKDVRNTMNHASKNLKYQPESIILALKYYMKWVEALNPNK